MAAKNKRGKAQKSTKKTEKATSGKNQFSGIKLIVANLILIVAVLALINVLKTKNSGYKWVVEDLINQNIKTQKKLKHLNMEKRMEAKHGLSYVYLDYIKRQTPENAIILMPPDSSLYPKGKKAEFGPHLKIKTWATYFVYPRRLVYQKEAATSPLYKKATHIAIANFWGYDKLNYPVNKENRVKHTVLPINKN